MAGQKFNHKCHGLLDQIFKILAPTENVGPFANIVKIDLWYQLDAYI